MTFGGFLGGYCFSLPAFVNKHTQVETGTGRTGSEIVARLTEPFVIISFFVEVWFGNRCQFNGEESGGDSRGFLKGRRNERLSTGVVSSCFEGF